ncbi:hypothetical protein BGZ49_000168 [Haplosporangium sp. Z 27]|nr:hypothetical protein BGZ49_000168 [Haplosporangium sp. Z 27]
MVCLSALTAQAHVGLSTPCGRYQPAAGCPAPPAGQSIDYNINAPIGTHDSIVQPICKHTVPYTTRTSYKAGETIETAYSVGAPHGGGHCQWALSYDKGQTWVVIQTEIRTCLQTAVGGKPFNIKVTIPKDAPAGPATFQWIWNNAIGNRELYSNCADIEITNSKSTSLTGVEPLFANYGPKSVLIPEFPTASDPDGSAAFKTRKPITIHVGKGKAISQPKPSTHKPSTHKPTTTHKPAPKTTHKASSSSKKGKGTKGHKGKKHHSKSGGSSYN